jgi:hypothetical protein
MKLNVDAARDFQRKVGQVKNRSSTYDLDFRAPPPTSQAEDVEGAARIFSRPAVRWIRPRSDGCDTRRIRGR